MGGFAKILLVAVFVLGGGAAALLYGRGTEAKAPPPIPTVGVRVAAQPLKVGTFLDAVGTDRLQSLQLKTPLSKTRLPVKLPRIEDFPYISYLDAEELRAEVDRLRGMDLSYPRDREVEEERRYFLRLLESAVGQNRGVVGFYY